MHLFSFSLFESKSRKAPPVAVRAEVLNKLPIADSPPDLHGAPSSAHEVPITAVAVHRRQENPAVVSCFREVVATASWPSSRGRNSRYIEGSLGVYHEAASVSLDSLPEKQSSR